MDLVAVPVKPFGLAKARLAAAFDGRTRAALSRATATHTVLTILDAIGQVAVVTGDSDVANWASSLGADVIDEDVDLQPGLNGAAQQVVSAASGAWMIVHADLPLLTGNDIKTAWAAVRSGRLIIAPSHDGGTSVIGGIGPGPAFSYGPGSFHRHLAALRDHGPNILTMTGFLLDLDDPSDFEAALSHPAGSWLKALNLRTA